MKGGSVHFFPEGYLSPYCREIRPFQRGAFLFAYDCGVPIVPFVITYREPLPLRRLLRRCPSLTLQILPPVYPDLQRPPPGGNRPSDDGMPRPHGGGQFAACKINFHQEAYHEHSTDRR